MSCIDPNELGFSCFQALDFSLSPTLEPYGPRVFFYAGPSYSRHDVFNRLTAFSTFG